MGPVERNSDCIGQSLRDDPHFEELRAFWSRALGAYGPQWMIILALQKLDDATGAKVQSVAAMLDVDPAFVTTHSRFLERKGFVTLSGAAESDPALRLSLTKKARQHLADFATRTRNN